MLFDVRSFFLFQRCGQELKHSEFIIKHSLLPAGLIYIPESFRAGDLIAWFISSRLHLLRLKGLKENNCIRYIHNMSEMYSPHPLYTLKPAKFLLHANFHCFPKLVETRGGSSRNFVLITVKISISSVLDEQWKGFAWIINLSWHDFDLTLHIMEDRQPFVSKCFFQSPRWLLFSDFTLTTFTSIKKFRKKKLFIA